MVDSDEKLSYFQAITGIDDLDLCAEILAAHQWDLDLAISSFTSPNLTQNPNSPNPNFENPNFEIPNSPNPNFENPNSDSDVEFLQDSGPLSDSDSDSDSKPLDTDVAPGLAWKLITLPFAVISGSLGLISGAISLCVWVAGGVFRHSFGIISRTSTGAGGPADDSWEDLDFVVGFEKNYGGFCPNFISEGFNDALERSRREFKLLFVYLHSPEDADTQSFCEGTLCSEVVVEFINENFVSWGENIWASEGLKMRNRLKGSRFPFCAVVMGKANQRIVLLEQIEGPRSPVQMLAILQRVHEQNAYVLITARCDAEERRNAILLREEQDAAYRAALEADQDKERQRKEEQEQLEREAAEAEKKQKEEEEAQERLAREAAEKEAALARRRQEKAMSIGAEPEKGPNVSQVLVRFPAGQRKERRFDSSATIQSLYDYVDSLDYLKAEKFSLVSNFPRVIYSSEKHSLSLKEAGLHPQASLFIEMDS
ncbi:plant UBX domain-containing protein 10-like [Tasmannia lanceolata]|uniref:plant UBX domain-containing protein 10-like n=1 Tax=Tasmannia lanceolata TaxID=3420 RepID=UPI00406433CD